MKKTFLIFKLFLLVSLFSLAFSASVQARDQFFKGRVYVKIDNREVEEPLKGVIVYREDEHSQSQHLGVISVSLNNQTQIGDFTFPVGGYGFLYNRSVGEGLPISCGDEGHCCGNKSCPVVLLGGGISDAQCAGHYHCGLSCSDENEPHRILAYFPRGYDGSNLRALGIGFVGDDMKGGGSWQFHIPSNVSNVSLPDQPLSFNAADFGSVTYNSGEWIQVRTLSNQSGRSNVDIEWIPADNFSCTGLSSNAGEEVELGQRLSFTCGSSLGGLSLSGYNYRVKGPSDTDWVYPPGWSDLSGSTPEYEVTEVGPYQVQCQVCVSFQGDEVCTSWGQAN